jgi:hypothetical protein
MGTMGLKSIIAAYFALVAMLCAAGIFALSVQEMHESRSKALDNAYSLGPEREPFGKCL